jgi:hypothetical protein
VGALGVGLPYAAISLYWALGGTWLLDTVSGSLAEQVRLGNVGPGVALAVFGAAILKLVGAVLPILSVQLSAAGAWHASLRALLWLEATVLIAYGLVLTVVGLLVQSGLIAAAPDADKRALAWHAFLWDPWFLVWGALVAAYLLLTRRREESSV